MDYIKYHKEQGERCKEKDVLCASVAREEEGTQTLNNKRNMTVASW